MIQPIRGSNKSLGITLVLTLLFAALLVPQLASSAATNININAGGPAQTVNGTAWKACSSTNNCSGYVSGGDAYAERPAPAVSGYASNTNAAIHQTEWTGGQADGLAPGTTAFTFSIPVVAATDYDVKLHFTELNKFAAGSRLFDVKINNATVLSNFDIFATAGGAYKTIVQTFRATGVNGKITIAFITRVENAKVDAVELVPVVAGSTTTTTAPTTTTSTPTTTSSTSTTSPSSTSTTATTTPTTTSSTLPAGAGFNTVKWTSMANSPFSSVEGAGGILNGKLYNFGGYSDPSWTNPNGKSAAYDISTNKWTTLPNMPVGDTHAGRVIDGNTFILLGGVIAVGSGQTHATTGAWRFDTDTNKWSTFPSLPAARGSGTAALVGRQLHFIGGVDANLTEHDDHWVIDLDNLAAGWHTEPAFPGVRSHFASLTIGSSIYTFGGQHGWEETASPLADVYRYDTVAKQWSKMANLPLALSHIEESTVLVGQQVWVFGGEHVFAQNGTTGIYIYDIPTDTWRKSTSSMPAIREAAIVGNVGSTIYEAFGEWTTTQAWKGSLQ